MGQTTHTIFILLLVFSITYNMLYQHVLRNQPIVVIEQQQQQQRKLSPLLEVRKKRTKKQQSSSTLQQRVVNDNKTYNNNNNNNKDPNSNTNPYLRQQKTKPKQQQQQDNKNNNKKRNMKKYLSQLDCTLYGGPYNKDNEYDNSIVQDMVYWHDIPKDDTFVSPYYNYGPKNKYITVEPDEGGWNNKRMSMETSIALAYVTGRTLVLPPKQKSKKNTINEGFFVNYDDVFTLQTLLKEHGNTNGGGGGISMISMEEFLLKEAMNGNLLNKTTNVPSFPPENNRTNWDDDERLPWWQGQPLWPWLREVTTTSPWDRNQCVLAIPQTPGGIDDDISLINYMEDIKQYETKNKINELIRIENYINNPTPVNATPIERLYELLGHRHDICIYNETYQQTKVIHIMGDSDSGTRLLTHFYSFLFVEDWHLDLYIKRFVRDHLRYSNDIQCTAARIVKEMKLITQYNHNSNNNKKKNNNNNNDNDDCIDDDNNDNDNDNINDNFHTMHIRRGDFLDFQRNVNISAYEIYQNIRSLIPNGSTIYIATDETNMEWFQPLRDYYYIYFLHDFQHLLVPLVQQTSSSSLYNNSTTSTTTTTTSTHDNNNNNNSTTNQQQQQQQQDNNNNNNNNNNNILQQFDSTYLGMLEQRIASKGKIFIGTYYSSFTGYINRMRAYHSQIEDDEEDDNDTNKNYGIIPSYHYAERKHKYSMRQYHSISSPLWAREFPVAWRDIDHDVE